MSVIKKILNNSQELFFRYGVKSVTMDDIARHLGISKKTLYQHFDNKKDLISQSILNHFDCEEKLIVEMKDQVKNAIEEMLIIANYVNEQLKRMNPVVIYDLKKYYKENWKTIHDKQMKLIYTITKENLEQGIEEGVYRKDINTDVIAKFYMGRTDMILDDVLFPTSAYNHSELHRELTYYHLYAIVSNDGFELLKKYQTQKIGVQV